MAEALPLAVVTGAAHRIGLAIALELARQGYAIGLHYHRSSEKAAAAEEQVRALGVPVYPLPADFSEPVQVENLFLRIASLGHPLKVLVNSAAVMPRGDLREMPVEE